LEGLHIIVPKKITERYRGNLPKTLAVYIGKHSKAFAACFNKHEKDCLDAVEMYKILANSHDSKLAGKLDEEIARFRKWSGPKKMQD
jgi:hypothetical protein